MWYCQWHKYAFETNLGGQKSIWNCIQSFFFIFLSLGFGSSSFFFSPSFAAGSSFSFGFFLNMNSEIKGRQKLCGFNRLTWRTWCRRRPNRERRWSHKWELAGQSCPPPQCSCLLETFDPFLELFHTLSFSSSRYGLSQAGGIRLRPPVCSRLPRWVHRCESM